MRRGEKAEAWGRTLRRGVSSVGSTVGSGATIRTPEPGALADYTPKAFSSHLITTLEAAARTHT